jgi:hypothetical protein
MSLTKAQPDSMAPDQSAQRPENNAGGDSVAMLGYSVVANPSQMPARSNSDVGITADFGFTEVNQGTSFPSYDQQSETVGSESGS